MVGVVNFVFLEVGVLILIVIYDYDFDVEVKEVCLLLECGVEVLMLVGDNYWVVLY